MIDKKLEKNIKMTREFIELWDKFYNIFKSVLKEGRLQEDKETEFLSVKTLVNSRYEDLMDSLGKKPLGRIVKTPFIYNILSLEKLSIMSDGTIKSVDKDWVESFNFLKGLKNRLEKKRAKIGEFNKFAFVLKKGIQKLK